MITRFGPPLLAISAILWLTGCDPSGDVPLVGISSADDPLNLPANDTVLRASPKCELQIELPAQIKHKTHGITKILIKNVSDAPVTLVMPGDGSDCRWRTPVIGWSVLPHESKDRHPKEPPKQVVARCGNINRLQADEVFVLQPGTARELNERVYFPYRVAPGRYRVAFYYSNVPDLKWQGIPLGEHDEEAMRRVKDSTPVSLVSNEVQVEITD